MQASDVPELSSCPCSLTFQKAIYPVLAEVNGTVESLYILQSSQENQMEIAAVVPPTQNQLIGKTVRAALNKSKAAKVPEVPPTVVLPEGHTYESWILQEGLHNVRKLRLQNLRTEDHPFFCPICDKKYKNANGIKYHAKYAHGPKKIFTCETCQRNYATRHGLSAHKRNHAIEAASASLERSSRKQKLSPLPDIPSDENVTIE